MRRKTIIRIVVAVVAAASIGAWFVFSHDSPINRASAINATYAWARLSPFPRSAENIEVETTGTMFTRQFRISFTAPPEDIQAWLSDSPGTKDATPEMQQDGTTRYSISPGGGAQFAELYISKDKRRVLINTYWS